MVSFNDKISNLDSNNRIEKMIIDAFMTLYAEKSIEKINIKMITDLAGLNRGTFYLHYLDIYDLFEKIENKYSYLSKTIAINAVNALFNNEILETALPTINFYETNLEHLKILLCINGKSSLNQVMKNELKKSISSYDHNVTFTNTVLNEYALEYITSAQVATIIHWIRNDMNVSLDKISKLIQDLTANGLLNFLK
jgi:AcrR family transcriptional regulator